MLADASVFLSRAFLDSCFSSLALLESTNRFATHLPRDSFVDSFFLASLAASLHPPSLPST